MRKNILNAKFIVDMGNVTANMYHQGWDERNGGNVSWILTDEELKPYINLKKVKTTFPLNFKADPILRGKNLLITGTGKYFKNIKADPETNLGIIRIADDLETAELLWGFKDGGKFTSECPAHLMSHATRLKIDPNHRIVMHTHPTYTMSMSFICDVDDEDWTLKLWHSNTEAVVVFPDGVGVLPCMVCGTSEIGEATAEKLKVCRFVVWTNHGIYATGTAPDDIFGLIETVEKTAQVYMLTLGHVKNSIPNEVIQGLIDLWHLNNRFEVK